MRNCSLTPAVMDFTEIVAPEIASIFSPTLNFFPFSNNYFDLMALNSPKPHKKKMKVYLSAVP